MFVSLPAHSHDSKESALSSRIDLVFSMSNRTFSRSKVALIAEAQGELLAKMHQLDSRVAAGHERDDSFRESVFREIHHLNMTVRALLIDSKFSNI
jgi:hypothetical protein